MRKVLKAKERSQRAVELLGSAIDVKISELTQSNRQLKRKIFDLYTIFEISRNFNSVLNYKTLIDSFLLTSLGQVLASSAAVYLPPTGNSPAMSLAQSKGLSREDMVAGQIDRNGRLATYLTAVARPVTVAELGERFADAPEFQPIAAFHDGLVMPLIIKSELRGILVLGGKVSGVGFAADDIEFLSILSNQFIIALENARLYESEKQALQDLTVAQKQLVLSERLAAIGELSAKIAHEINNPLSIISNYLLLCDRTLNDPRQSRDYLGVAREELTRIARIVRQLLDFHRPVKVEKVPIRIKEVVDSVVNLVEWQLVERRISVERLADEPLPVVIGSPEQLKQVFLNLIINARDFMPDGGQIRIEISGDETGVRVSFTDGGKGIPEEHLPRIFEPFFTTKEDGSGTGLGLSVCYGIIADHGGRIEASNAPAGGSRFVITLPAAYGNEEQTC